MSDRLEYMQNTPDRQYRDRVDIKIIFNNQVQRCLQAIGTEYFPETVEALARILPTASYEKVMNRKNEWVTEVEDFEYTYDGPIWFGTPDKPMMKLKPNGLDEYPTPYIQEEEGNKVIDWSNPNIISPRLVIKEKEDHMLFMRFILEEAENVNITWRSDSNNTEYGLYPSKEDLDLGTPTPLDDSTKKNDHPEQNPLHQKCWINYKGTPKLVTNFRGYAVGIGDNEKPWFFNEIAIDQTKQKPIVIMITATQGKGKTYCGIRLAEILDKHFDPDEQIVMARKKILSLVSGRSGLKRNQAIIVDESQWGASAREWGNKEQIKLMKFLSAARFRGYIIIIVALHRSMLDTIIRERIINYHIHMEERGRSTVYAPTHSRFDEQRYPTRKGGLILQLPDYDACDYITCLTCEKNETCMTTRARYERNKSAFIEGEAEKDAKEEMRQAASEMSEQELAKMVAPVIDEIGTNTKGFYEVTDIQTALAEHYGLDISIRHATRIRAYLMKLIPPPKP